MNDSSAMTLNGHTCETVTLALVLTMSQLRLDRVSIECVIHVNMPLDAPEQLYSSSQGMHHTVTSQLCHLRSTDPALTTQRQLRARTVTGVTHRTLAMTLGTALQHMQEDSCIYLDYNATTPIFPEVRRLVQRSLGCFCLLSYIGLRFRCLRRWSRT